ncbi:MAG: hypothetical protein QM692_21950 [Thermomicrobiales bacterium]
MPTGADPRPNDDASFGRVPTMTVGATSAPFAWQDGRRLWLLDGRPRHWVLAELEFDQTACRYIEVRRATYRWPREAAGALLGRTIASGEHMAESAAQGLSDWAIRANMVL